MTVAAPVTESRGYAGADTVAPEVAGPAEATSGAPPGSPPGSPPGLEPGTGEVLPVPVPPPEPTSTSRAEPAAAAPQPAPGPTSGPRPAGGEPRPGEPRPKWWGPYPRPKLTGFGGPVLQLTGLDGNFAAMVGLAGGLTIRQRVSIGATGMWLLNPSDAGRTSVGAPRRLNANFGGLLLAVVFARVQQRADFTFEAIVGGGGACLQNPETGTCYDRTAMFVAQPSLGVHVRLAPIVRLVFGFGYRVVVARAWSGPESRALSAPVGTVMLELGLF